MTPGAMPDGGAPAGDGAHARSHTGSYGRRTTDRPAVTRRKAARPKRRAPAARPPGEVRVALSPMFVIAAANAFAGLDLTAGAVRAFGGPPSVAERFLHEVHAMPDYRMECTSCELPTWDAAFVHHVGYWALYTGVDRRSMWPLPPVVTAQELSEVAGHGNRFVLDPAPGDLFLLWNPARRLFVRTGFVVRVHAAEPGDRPGVRVCDVIEGSTSKARDHNGPMVLRHRRSFGPDDRFVRWTSRPSKLPGGEFAAADRRPALDVSNPMEEDTCE